MKEENEKIWSGTMKANYIYSNTDNKEQNVKCNENERNVKIRRINRDADYTW